MIMDFSEFGYEVTVLGPAGGGMVDRYSVHYGEKSSFTFELIGFAIVSFRVVASKRVSRNKCPRGCREEDVSAGGKYHVLVRHCSQKHAQGGQLE
jgi:hypothetical protein